MLWKSGKCLISKVFIVKRVESTQHINKLCIAKRYVLLTKLSFGNFRFTKIWIVKYCAGMQSLDFGKLVFSKACIENAVKCRADAQSLDFSKFE